MDLKYWTKALREAERELEAATTRSAVDAAARKAMRAKAELKLLKDVPERGRGVGLAVAPGRRALDDAELDRLMTFGADATER